MRKSGSKNTEAMLRLVRIKKFELHYLIRGHVDKRRVTETKKNTLIALVQWYKKFAKFLVLLDQRTVSLSNQGIGKDYKKYLEKLGHANWTVQLHLRAFQAILNKESIPHHFNLRELFRDYARHNKANEDYFMSDKDVKELISYKPKKKHERIVLDRFIISCFTGARVSEVKTVNPVDDLTLRYTSSKTQKEVLVPYPDILKPLIESAEYARQISKAYEGSNQNTVLHDIMKRLKWNDKIKTYQVYGKNKVEAIIYKYDAISFHDGRKFYGKMLLDRDVSMYKTSQLLGHSSVSTTEKFYASLSKEKLIKESVSIINNF